MHPKSFTSILIVVAVLLIDQFCWKMTMAIGDNQNDVPGWKIEMTKTADINNLMTTWWQRVSWQDVIDNLMTTWWQHDELTRCHGQPEDNGSLWQVNSCGHKPGMSHFHQNDKYQPIKITCPFLFLSEPSIVTMQWLTSLFNVHVYCEYLTSWTFQARRL